MLRDITYRTVGQVSDCLRVGNRGHGEGDGGDGGLHLGRRIMRDAFERGTRVLGLENFADFEMEVDSGGWTRLRRFQPVSFFLFFIPWTLAKPSCETKRDRCPVHHMGGNKCVVGGCSDAVRRSKRLRLCRTAIPLWKVVTESGK